MYAKVFAQMYDGSLCTQGPWQALVTFQQFLVLADQDGTVDMTAEAIARRTTIPLEIIETGIAELLKPDRKSRTPTEEGRRIIPLAPGRDWGWQVVNYVHYRTLKREEDRRAYHREYWHKRNKTQHTQQSQPIAEAEADAKPNRKKSCTAAQAQTLPPPDFLGDENEGKIKAAARVLIAEKWELPLSWGTDGEALGWKPSELLKESERFRQYWVSGKGAGTRRTLKGWRQSWSNWLAKAERFSGDKA